MKLKKYNVVYQIGNSKKEYNQVIYSDTFLNAVNNFLDRIINKDHKKHIKVISVLEMDDKKAFIN